MRSSLRRRPDATTWLVARDISQWAEPDVRPLDRADSAFITERTRRLSTLLTGDVPPQHLLCHVHSTGRRRQGHPADGSPVQSIVETARPVLYGALYSSSLIREASPCAPRIHRSRVSGHKKIAPAANISSSKYYFRDVPGPTCRGSTLLYIPPLAIKGEACNATRELRPNLDSQFSSLHSNPTYSGVGCYAPAARTTLNSRVFMCLMFA
jgi:hypothetical protein